MNNSFAFFMESKIAGPRGCIEDEFKSPMYPKITNDCGTVAVANSGIPHSGGGQVILRRLIWERSMFENMNIMLITS